jgi:hypothetical protein
MESGFREKIAKYQKKFDRPVIPLVINYSFVMLKESASKMAGFINKHTLFSEIAYWLS